jgi:hypothetical protein
MIVDIRGRLTLTVPEAGRIIYGIGRDAAYAAAARGEIPVRSVGRTLRVPTYLALLDVGFSDGQIAAVLGLPRSTGDHEPNSVSA